MTCNEPSGPGITATRIQTGFNNPVFLGAPNLDSRLFVVERRGQIKIISDGETSDMPFLDIRSRVTDASGEQGLLGLAFHPNYSENGRFFVNYTAADAQGATVIAEYKVSSSNPDKADIAETRRLTIAQPQSNHNGGMIAFGPDGFLYIGMGDGGGGGDPQNNGQNESTLLGAMLRIDIDSGATGYAIPADNPFAGDAQKAQEIWATGLRNPWRFSFDRVLGDMYIGDVGQESIEELDFAPAGQAGLNFGWPIKEGSECFRSPDPDCSRTDLVDPIYEYDSTNRCSIVGGYMYRGACLEEYQEAYFFADFCTSEVFVMTSSIEGERSVRDITSILGGPSQSDLISSFGEDGKGELYIVTLGGNVYKIGSESE